MRRWNLYIYYRDDNFQSCFRCLDLLREQPAREAKEVERRSTESADTNYLSKMTE